MSCCEANYFQFTNLSQIPQDLPYRAIHSSVPTPTLNFEGDFPLPPGHGLENSTCR